MDPLQLHLHVSGQAGRAEYVCRCPILLGRLPRTGVPLRDIAVSRTHARLSCDGTALVVRDLDSEAGTTVIAAGERHVLRDTSVTIRGGRAELILGATTVHARLEVPSYVLPDAAIDAARIASAELRYARGHASLATSNGTPVSPASLLDGIYQSVYAMRTAFQTIDAHTRTDRTPSESHEALVLWTRELMTSIAHAASALRIELQTIDRPLSSAVIPAEAEVALLLQQLPTCAETLPSRAEVPILAASPPQSMRLDYFPKRGAILDRSTPTSTPTPA